MVASSCRACHNALPEILPTLDGSVTAKVGSAYKIELLKEEAMRRPSPLVWMDLEMTGLEPDQHDIIEIGTVVTDQDLKVIANGPALVIHQPESSLAKMDAWCVEQHGKSGLTGKVRASTISLEQAQRQTLQFLATHCKPGESPLCGNSIWQDRRFLMKFMPELNAFFHYRNIDVSSIKELALRWYPGLKIPKKSKSHQVIKDIEESIDELRFYRQTLFRESAIK